MSLTCTKPASRTKKTAKPKDRTIRLLAKTPTANGTAGIFAVTEGDKTDRYFFQPMACDFGAAAYLVEKWSDVVQAVVEEYHVSLDGKESSCECKGHLRWGHCRHVEGLSALIAAKKI
jgi:hypothetical protein